MSTGGPPSALNAPHAAGISKSAQSILQHVKGMCRFLEACRSSSSFPPTFPEFSDTGAAADATPAAILKELRETLLQLLTYMHDDIKESGEGRSRRCRATRSGKPGGSGV